MPGVGAHLDTSPSLLPIPALDGHVVTTRQDETERRVDCQTSDVIWVRLERGDLLSRRDVVDSELKVVRAGDELGTGSAEFEGPS